MEEMEDRPIEDYDVKAGAKIATDIITCNNPELVNRNYIDCNILDRAVSGLCGCFPDDMEFYGNDIKEFISTFLQEYKESS